MALTTSLSEATAATLVADLSQLAALMHENAEPSMIWTTLGRVLAQHFGYSLFTILIYSPIMGQAYRVHSTRPDLHPLGPRHSQGTNSTHPRTPPEREAWVERVIVQGQTWRGSTREDLKAVFEDGELLWSVGLGSVLNIPVCVEGRTIGSLNILDSEHAYDTAQLEVGILIAQMVALYVYKAGVRTGLQADGG
ncbi:GAF domain-containing protein [Cladophialophora immunda]|nr:GAF domain-containing protein [Cladophialophora immunda]